YTPPPIVNFIVRAIDDVIINTFGYRHGLADAQKVTVLDFATGTGTFLADIFKQVLQKFPADSAQRKLLVKEHLLKNIYGFEYLIAPYTIAHLKLSQYLKEEGYAMQQGERLNVFLTNTLEPVDKQIRIPLLPALTEEAKEAQRVKDKSILVITGNPPYSYVSKNNGEWITEKIKEYYFVDGRKLNERNPKGLQDDYVKFIRFAQDKMNSVDEGIVGIITNHSFLDNPTFRGMRQSLMNTFDQMYFIDLHGNAKKKEKTPDGGKDENVFDIEQGVAISLLVKKKGLEKKIYHTDWWGKRKEKYQLGWEMEMKENIWRAVIAESPFYLFVPIDDSKKEKYLTGKKVTEIFLAQGVGVATSRDNLCIQFDKESLMEKLKEFTSIDVETARQKFHLGPDADDWKISLAQQDVLIHKSDDEKVIKYLYRPFDMRYTFFTGATKGFHSRPRKEIMRHLLKENTALFIGRQGQALGTEEWNLIFVGDKVEDYNLFRRGNNACLPLYVYNENKTENFQVNFRKYIDELYQHHYTPEQILGYIYAILHSPTYRTKYAEFLKIDFPRIPFTPDKNIFEQLSNLGADLVEVHLLKKEIHLINTYLKEAGGAQKVDKPEYKSGKLYINSKDFLDNIPREVYDFYIGGYQVLDKYLKDRRGRILNLHEVEHLPKIVNALAFTLEQMKKIDELTREWI
ncbi:MAG: type ISP restriction/modification enzyme, partial [Chitinophagaceae bacterium]